MKDVNKTTKKTDKSKKMSTNITARIVKLKKDIYLIIEHKDQDEDTSWAITEEEIPAIHNACEKWLSDNLTEL